MSTSMDKHPLTKYFIISILLMISTYIYEQFSHGIHSNFMRLSFLIPLLGGFIILGLHFIFKYENEKMIKLWHMGLTSLVFGFLLNGVYEIYGSKEPLVIIFFYIGGIICFISLWVYVSSYIKHFKKISSKY